MPQQHQPFSPQAIYPPLHFTPMPPPSFTPQKPAAITRIPDFIRMSGRCAFVQKSNKSNMLTLLLREIATIANFQKRGVDTGNQYIDDFYKMHYEERKSVDPEHVIPGLDLSNNDRPAHLLSVLKALQRGERVMLTSPAPLQNALPPTTSTNAAVEARRQKLAQHSQTWASSNQVLGRVLKSNIRTPRELIMLHDTIVPRDDSSSFASATWKLRANVYEIWQLLDEIADTNMLLKSRASRLAEGMMGPVPDEVSKGMEVRENKLHDLCVSLARALGLIDGSDEKLLGLLWLSRGRKAVCQSIKVCFFCLCVVNNRRRWGLARAFLHLLFQKCSACFLNTSC